MINATAAAGIPILPSTTERIIRPTPGVPEEPIDTPTATNTTSNNPLKPISTPKIWAKNRVATLWYKAVPLIFMAALSGTTN